MNNSASERDDAGAAEAAAPSPPRRIVNPDLLWVESVTERLLGSSEPPTWERAPIGEQVTGGTRSATLATPVTAPTPVASPAVEPDPEVEQPETADLSEPVQPAGTAESTGSTESAVTAESTGSADALEPSEPPSAEIHQLPVRTPRAVSRPLSYVEVLADRPRIRLTEEPPPVPYFAPTAAPAQVEQEQPAEAAPPAEAVARTAPVRRPAAAARPARSASGEDMPAGVLRAALRDALPDDTARRPSAVDAIFGDAGRRVTADAPEPVDAPAPVEPGEPPSAPAVDEPVVERPAPAPAVQQPVVEQPAAAAPAVDQPVVEQPAPAPAVDQPVVEQPAPAPAVDQPVVEQPAPAPAVQQPTAAPAVQPAAAPEPGPVAPAAPPAAVDVPAPPSAPPTPAPAAATVSGRHRTPDVTAPGTDVTAIRMALRSGDENLSAAVLALIADRGRERERVRMVEAYLDAVLAEGDDGLAGAARLRRLLGE